ncbi:MAG: uracil-DNA glycosylase, partial [Deltaproteobacteria bacterium]|nr:uracil-DNA glycosylase [Deltaproteobacteria bacterium]
NLDPQEDEAAACTPFLWRQIEAIGPRVICTLGAHAARAVLGGSGPLAEMRGRSFEVRGRAVLPTYHPAYLLQNPSAKRLAWDDLRRVKEALEGRDP